MLYDVGFSGRLLAACSAGFLRTRRSRTTHNPLNSMCRMLRFAVLAVAAATCAAQPQEPAAELSASNSAALASGGQKVGTAPPPPPAPSPCTFDATLAGTCTCPSNTFDAHGCVDTPEPEPELTLGKDATKGTSFGVNVYYSNSADLTCKDKDNKEAGISLDPEECTCLYTLLVACIASIKLDTTKNTDSGDEDIDASVYLGGDCSGTAILGGDTDITCDTCDVANLGPLGNIGIEIVCPFSAFGMCPKAGVAIGAPCMTACVVVVCAALFCCCCAAKAKSSRRRAPAMYVQQRYIQQPQGFQGYGSE